MWNELFITYNGPSLFCELLANYTRAVDKQIVRLLKLKQETCKSMNLDNIPFITTPTGKKLSSAFEIGEFISNITGLSHMLVGRSEKDVELHKKFFDDLNNSINPYLFINDKLNYDTFINGNLNITISDLYAYAFVLVNIVKFNDSDKLEFPNLVRWALHIQSLEGISKQITRLNMKISPPYDKVFINLNVEDNLTNKKVNNKKAAKEAKEDPSLSATKHLDEEKQKEIEKKIELARQEKEAKKKEKENQPKTNKNENNNQDKNKKTVAKKEEDDRHPISKLDIRVGQIISIEENKDSDKLFNEVIDFGNGLQRKIASGLKGKIDINSLKNALVVCILNLKERTLCNWPSHGMLLCCNKNNAYDFIRPPSGSKPGDLVSFGNFSRQPDEVLNPKKNPWDLVKDKITVNSKGVAVFDDEHEWKTDKGVITSELTSSVIS